jgi:hypothetical protein
VYEPETRQKYSNAAVAVIGRVLEKTKGSPFAEYLTEHVLDPLGLQRSSFELDSTVRKHVARASMWAYDGRVFEAPTFRLGTNAAGNLYSSVLDLSRFLQVIFARGKTPGGRLLRPETLEAMWVPQLASEGSKEGFGIGFFVSEFEGQRRVGHNGAVYGFSTSFLALPEVKLGVAAVSSRDVTNAVVSRIADHALRCMLALRNDEALPEWRSTGPVPGDLARTLPGTYAHESETIQIHRRGGRVFLEKDPSIYEVRCDDEGLIVDSRLGHGLRLEASGEADTITIRGRTYRRRADTAPAPIPPHWRGLVGEYGWDHIPLCILEKKAPRAHRVVLFLPPGRGLGKRLQLPGLRPLPRRAAHLQPGRAGRGFGGRRGGRGLPAPKERLARGRVAADSAAATGRGDARGGPEGRAAPGRAGVSR